MVRLEHDNDGVARHMRCSGCGERTAFDEALPYVNQTASFSTGHGCVAVDDLWIVELPCQRR